MGTTLQNDSLECVVSSIKIVGTLFTKMMQIQQFHVDMIADQLMFSDIEMRKQYINKQKKECEHLEEEIKTLIKAMLERLSLNDNTEKEAQNYMDELTTVSPDITYVDVDECESEPEPEIKTEIQRVDDQATIPANDTFVDAKEAETPLSPIPICVPSASEEPAVTKSLPMTTIKVYNSRTVSKGSSAAKQKPTRAQTSSTGSAGNSEPFVTVLLPMANDDALNVEEKYDHLSRTTTDDLSRQEAATLRPVSKKRKQYEQNDMADAITAVTLKLMGFKKAAQAYNVPKTTLRRLSSMSDGTCTPIELTQTKMGRRPLLPLAVEETLVNYAIEIKSKYYGLTKNELKMFALQLAKENNLDVDTEQRILGKEWVKSFLHRHRHRLPTTKPMSHEFIKENTCRFFVSLADLYRERNFAPSRIFNVNGSAITITQPRRDYEAVSVVAMKGEAKIAKLSANERHNSLITVVVCMNASGLFIPPLIIFPGTTGETSDDQLMSGAPPQSISACHLSGWIQPNMFTAWLKHFIRHAKPSAADPILLILDSHCHYTKTLDVINLARENSIRLLCVPPFTSYQLQPLERSFMRSLTGAYAKEVKNFVCQNERSVSEADKVALFGTAYQRVSTEAVAAKGFSVTGIYPLNRSRLAEAEFFDVAEARTLMDVEESSEDETVVTVYIDESDVICQEANLVE